MTSTELFGAEEDAEPGAEAVDDYWDEDDYLYGRDDKSHPWDEDAEWRRRDVAEADETDGAGDEYMEWRRRDVAEADEADGAEAAETDSAMLRRLKLETGWVPRHQMYGTRHHTGYSLDQPAP